MRKLFAHTECVIFDFDGPLCSLFAVRTASSVAERLRTLADEHQLPVPATDDPHAVLRAAAASHPGSAASRLLEEELTREEVHAAATARPTTGAAALVHALSGRGRRLAVASNNSALAVSAYLGVSGLAGQFHDHVHGRAGEVALLKPHPDVVHRALCSTGAPPDRSLMIGDTPTDLAAAKAAGVAFLGFAPDRQRAEQLHAAGAEYVVTRLGNVLGTVNSLPSYDSFG
ncbi:HAD family hydrolase [Streptomyces spiramenti]|uniref:HAD family phosphatase n=1 Tax=Streptomyces spiramenti TaxID=2720606 RepID=A0ABX1AW66_9ACTN|nr:HAD family phosphatase [Streptomyces spiramenti]NJP69078.1 HAD family phosphatase [Streptomyces spiramenti]